MDLNLSIDMAKLKALPRRLKVVTAVIVIGLVIIGGAYVFSDELDEQAARVVQLKSQLTGLRQQNADLRRQIDQYPELVKRYNAAIGKGILADLDGVKLITDVTDLASRHHLTGLQYQVDAQDTKGPAAGKYRVASTRISFDSGAILDTEAMAFWDDVFAALPSHYQVVEASLDRVAEINPPLLATIRAGRPVSAVHVRIAFLWAALHSASQEGP